MNRNRLLAIGLAAALLVVAAAPTAAAAPDDPREIVCDDDSLGRYVQIAVLCEPLICVQEGTPCVPDPPPVRELLDQLVR